MTLPRDAVVWKYTSSGIPEAYMMLHDGSRAAAKFQMFIHQRAVLVNFPLDALARLGLARTCALQGNTANARAVSSHLRMLLW
jgi:hypothetical protein